MSIGTITLGPPALAFSWPDTESIASRISSASRRWRLNRQSSRLSGSFSAASAFTPEFAGGAEDCRYVLLLQNQPVDVLHAVAVRHEFVGQIIEQLRMRGTLAHAAEIVGRGDDAACRSDIPRCDSPSRARSADSRGRRSIWPVPRAGVRWSAAAPARPRASSTPSGRMPTRSPFAA